MTGRGDAVRPSGERRTTVASITLPGIDGWCRVVLDDGRRFQVDVEWMARHALAAGAVITPRLTGALAARDGYLRARERALRLLGIRPRSVAEIRSRLSRYRVPQDTLRAVIADLGARGYLDDLAFARSWITRRMASRPCGVKRLRWELRQKGVPSAVIERALGEVVDAEMVAAEERSASALAERRCRMYRHLPPDRQARRIAGALERRGFTPRTIVRALRAIGKAGSLEPGDD
jgi:regulatory protein